eukprot:gene9964-12793_t
MGANEYEDNKRQKRLIAAGSEGGRAGTNSDANALCISSDEEEEGEGADVGTDVGGGVDGDEDWRSAALAAEDMQREWSGGDSRGASVSSSANVMSYVTDKNELEIDELFRLEAVQEGEKLGRLSSK